MHSPAEVLKVTEVALATGHVQAVNARELHAFLGVGRDFSTWLKDRIDQYGFRDGSDYVSDTPQNGGALKSSTYGQGRIEYALSLDMAKELCMVERTERGKEARQYFIECERRAKAVPDLGKALADPAQLRGILLSYTEKVLALEAENAVLAPKAAFHDAVADAGDAQPISEVAKVLGMGPNRLFKTLREAGMLMKNNLPFQRYLNNGYFRVIEKTYTDSSGGTHPYSQTVITGKGLIFIQRYLAERHVDAA